MNQVYTYYVELDYNQSVEEHGQDYWETANAEYTGPDNFEVEADTITNAIDLVRDMIAEHVNGNYYITIDTDECGASLSCSNDVDGMTLRFAITLL